MNKKSLLFLLLTALFAPWAAYAQQNSLTLYEDATKINYYVPMFVFYFDDFTKAQTVFPAEDLAEMAGGTITAIKFYTNYMYIPYTTVSAADIYLTEVESPTISSFIDKSSATVVCQGYFDFVAADGGGEVTLTLTTPYVYQGGNLLFGCDNTEDVGYKGIYFYGKTANGASISGYNADAGGIINPTNRNFLPKTTFTYELGAVSCQRPTSITVSNITTVGATVTWEGEGNTWNLRYKASSDAYWTEITGLTNTSYNLTGLTAGTVYTVQVQSVCDDLTSGWTSSSFTTMCTAITSLPWNEDFEDYNTSNFTPACWVNEHIAGSQDQTFRITTSTLGGNSGRKLYLPSMSSGNMVKLCLPEMTLSTDTDYRFVLDIYRVSSSNSNEGIRVFASTDGEIEGATELAFIPRRYSVSNDVIPAEPLANTWYTYELPIPLHGTCYIILRGESGGYVTYLDNFVVEPISNCLRPTDLTVTNLSLHSATIGWTSDNENFQIRYRKYSESNNWTMVNNPSHPYTLTDLESGTSYVLEVRSVCGGDDGESRWALTSFTTLSCEAPSNLAVSNVRTSSATVNWTGNSDSYIVKHKINGYYYYPLTEDFESEASFANWTFISMNAANNIGDGVTGRNNYAAHHGEYGFRFSSWSSIQAGETYDQYLVSPQLSAANELKFYFRTNSDNRLEHLYVGYSTTTNDLNAFTWGADLVPTSQWQLHSQQLPANVKYIALHYFGDYHFGVLVDDIIISAYESVPNSPWNYITTEATSVTLNTLNSSTQYKVVVAPTCNETDESNAVIFNTFSCLMPENVAVSNTTMTSATLNWTCHSDSYTVKCRTAAYFEGISGEDFGYEFPSGWTRYTGPLNADGTGPTTPVNSGWSYFPSWSYGTFKSNIHPNWRNWLVTRAITINPGCSLSFNVRIAGDIPANPGNGGRFAVLISTDNKVHWTILREWNNTGSPYIWNNLVGLEQTINDINLNAYVGQTVYIAFYVNGLSSNWYGNDLFLSNVTCGRSIAAGAWQTVLSTVANTATIGNLYPDTKYEAVVVPSCNPTLASDIVSFSTVGCSVDEVEVSNIMEQSATVNWNSYSDGYTVKYRKTPIVSYPYEMGFEDENAFANWTFISNNAANDIGTTNGAGVHHTAAHSGLLGFRFSSYNTIGGGDFNDYIQYLISPLLNVSGNLRFYYRKSNRLYEGLSVGYSTTTNNLNAFTWTEDIGALQEWQAMTLSLPANVKYIAFRYNGANSYYAHIDDITIGECIVGNNEAWSTMNTSQATANLSNLTPGTEYEVKVSPSCDPSFESDVVYFTTKACSTPHFAEVSNISQHSVTVTWVGESESYRVKYRVVGGTGVWNSVTPVYTTTCTITAYIRPGLDYEIVVVPLCDETLESNHVFFSTPPCTISEDLEISDITHHSATVSWTGCSESYTVQYREAAGVLFSEDFEDAESFAEWTFISMNTPNLTDAGRVASAAHHGSYGFRFSSQRLVQQSGETWDQYLISPLLNVTGELSFDYRKFNTMPHKLYVGYSTTTNDLEAFTWSENIGLTTTWQTYTQTLPADVKYVALHYYGNWAGYVYIDDIAISVNEPGDWNTITTEATTASLNNLNIGTPYDVVVVPSCNTSQGSNVVTFSTLSCVIPENVEVSNIAHTTATVSWIGQSASYSVRYRTAASAYYPFTEGFESEPVVGWTFLSNNPANDIGQPNGAGISPDAAHSGSYGFMFSSWNDIPEEALAAGQTYSQCLISPQLTSGGTLTFQYRKSEAFTFNDEYFLVGYSTTDTTTFTWENFDISTSVNWQSSPEITLPANVKYIAIFCHNETPSYVYLDDINIRVDVPASTWSQVAASTSPADLTNLAQGTTYDVKVVPSCGASSESDVVTFTTMSNDFKLFVTEGDWSNPNNWEPVGVPTIDQDVELRANVTITGIAEANFITQGNHTITIEDGGQLKHSEYGINNALTVTIKKNITGYGYGEGNWYFITNPVINQITPSEENGLLNGPYDLYSWDATAADGLEWINFKTDNSPFTTLTSTMNGYLYANQNGTELSFYGVVRNSKNFQLKNVENNAGSYEFGAWALLGNPFVCDAYLVSANYNGTALACYRMNAEGTGFEAVEGAIAPVEGVFYEAPSTGYVYFTRTPPTRSGMLNMTVTQGRSKADNALIRFGEGNMLGKMSFREGSTKLYIPQDGKDYAVVNAGQSGEIPVNFKAEKNGTYTLNFNAEGVIASEAKQSSLTSMFSYLHLIDNLTGDDVNLLVGPSYTFEAKTTDYASRFKLVFSSGGVGNDAPFAFISNGNIIVNGEGTLQIIDVLGRVVARRDVAHASAISISGMPAGVYVLHLINGDTVRTQKIVID